MTCQSVRGVRQRQDTALAAPSGNDVTDRSAYVQFGVIAGAIIALAAAFWYDQLPSPFPWLEFVVMIAAAAATRKFGIPLPGRGFTSFVLGVVLYALLRHGWGWATLVAVVGMPAGDLPFRRLSLRGAFTNSGHLGFGTALVGLGYIGIGGQIGDAAFEPSNSVRLLGLLVALSIITNATFYLELSLSQAVAWVDSRLTLRWEAVVYVFSTSQALAWLFITRSDAPPLYQAVGSLLLVGLAAIAHWAARMGVHADELRLVQRLTSAIAADVNLSRSFATIQDLTHRLLPWHEMGFWRYREDDGDVEVLADTATTRPVGLKRTPRETGPLGEVIKRQQPLVLAEVHEEDEPYRSEILLPLLQGERLVGIWTIRHADPGAYRESDGQLLSTLAPSLALTLRLHTLVAPLVEASEQTASYVEHLTATSEEIHAGSEEVTAATQRAEAGAIKAANLVSKAEQAMTELRGSAHDAAAAGEETLKAAQQVEHASQAVQAATSKAAARLQRIGESVEQSTREVERLREAAESVGRFAETISAVASQTNMLALNATIEAARAGAHGAGFAVVADEVRRLAEESGAEAARAGRTTVETRRVLDNAAAQLERMRADLAETIAAANSWIAQLETIAGASATALELSAKMIEFPRRNTAQADALHALLGELRSTAHASASEAQAVAAAAAEQLTAIESLSKSAIQLSGSADRLAQATRFVQS